MASGSAFQYSTLATLGHPTSSVPPLPLLLVLQHPRRFSPSCTRTSSFCALSSLFLSFFLPLYLSPSVFPSLPHGVLFLPSRSSSSFSAAISSLSDRSSASSFGLRVLLFRSSAFLSFRSLADSSDELSSLRRHCGRIHSADFIERLSLSLSLCFSLLFLSLLFLVDSPRPLMDLSILCLLFD